MKGLVKQFKKLCPPAMLYLVLSAISFLGILMQNCQDPKKYKVGLYNVDIPCHNALFFIAKAIYILVWTWILQFLCKKGYKTVSWFLVLLPIIGMFLIIGLAIIFFLAIGLEVKYVMKYPPVGFEKVPHSDASFSRYELANSNFGLINLACSSI